MKKKSNILAVFILFAFFSCKSGNKENADQSMQSSPAIKVFMVTHQVANYDTWHSVYMAHDSVRKAYGISNYLLGRGMDDSNLVVVINKVEDFQKAKDFSNLPDLKEVMTKAGVTGPPAFSYANVIRNDSSKIEIKDRVMIIHRVKDFEAWLKVYDNEGPKTRSENGLMDRGLARDADDPNKVYIVFAITDMAKAKARMNSDELKKTMMNAGVEGPPQFIFYRLTE